MQNQGRKPLEIVWKKSANPEDAGGNPHVARFLRTFFPKPSTAGPQLIRRKFTALSTAPALLLRAVVMGCACALVLGALLFMLSWIPGVRR